MTSSAMLAVSTHHREVLRAGIHPGPPPHPGGVDEAQGTQIGVDDGVDRVPGRAGHIVHHRALRADQPVEQCGLADVGATDQRYGHLFSGRVVEKWFVGVILGDGLGVDEGFPRCAFLDRSRLDTDALGEQVDDGVQQVAGAATVESGDGEGIAQPEPEEGPDQRLAAGVVDLVGHDEHRGGPPTDQPGHLVVVVGGAHGGVDDQQDHVGLVERRLALGRHLGIEVVAALGPPAGVDQHEAPSGPGGLGLVAVAGDAGALLDDRLASADDAVEQRRLAHVGTADDRHTSERGVWRCPVPCGGVGGCRCAHLRLPISSRSFMLRLSVLARSSRPSAWRSATPSVATTSTRLGRSSGVNPSRNRPWDKQTSGSR